MVKRDTINEKKAVQHIETQGNGGGEHGKEYNGDGQGYMYGGERGTIDGKSQMHTAIPPSLAKLMNMKVSSINSDCSQPGSPHLDNGRKSEGIVKNKNTMKNNEDMEGICDANDVASSSEQLIEQDDIDLNLKGLIIETLNERDNNDNNDNENDYDYNDEEKNDYEKTDVKKGE